MFGYGVLVCEDCAGAVGAGVDGVDCGDDREEVLEFVEVIRGCGDGSVERVDEGGIEEAEGELGDDVGEVEGCFSY